MERFEYKVSQENGIHVRPAGLLVKEAGRHQSTLTIEANGKSADLKRLFAVMGLGLNCGDSMVITAVGADEREAISQIRIFMEEHL